MLSRTVLCSSSEAGCETKSQNLFFFLFHWLDQIRQFVLLFNISDPVILASIGLLRIQSIGSTHPYFKLVFFGLLTNLDIWVHVENRSLVFINYLLLD